MNVDDAQKIYKQPVANPYNDFSSSVKSSTFLPSLKSDKGRNRHSTSQNTLKHRETELGFDRYGQGKIDVDTLSAANKALMKKE